MNLKMQPLYWNNEGRFQKEYEELREKLVPIEGDADTVLGQLIRHASNVYYDIYNNGGYNLKLGHFVQARRYFEEKAFVLKEEAVLLGIENFYSKLRKFGRGRGTVRSRDEVVDVIVSYVYKNQPVGV